MDLYNFSNNKLEQIERQDFALEKEIQDLVESNVSELFNLQFISSEYQIGNFRLDTLCYDEDEKSFVIIEYKKGNSYSVVDQGLTYLSIVKENKGDVILEYNETQSENLKRTDVEWDNLRIIFISQSFNTYQKNSINFIKFPFELWEIKRFENGLISLDQLIASSQPTIKSTKSTDKQSVVSKVLKDIQTFTEENHTSKSSSETVEIWETFKSKMSEQFEINYVVRKHYIGLKKGSKLVTAVRFLRNKLDLDINRGDILLDNSRSKGFFSFDDAKNICKEKSWKYKSGVVGNSYGIQLSKSDEIDYIVYLLKQKYETL